MESKVTLRRKRQHSPKRDDRRDRGRRAAPTFDTQQWDDATLALAARSRMRCEIGGEQLAERDVERHHRKRKRDGGDRLANLLRCCSTHHHYAHEHPAWARERGFIVNALGIDNDPADRPVLLWGDTWVQLDDEGGALACDAPGDSAE